MIRLVLQVLLFIFPWSVRRWALIRLFGFDIASSARIGYSLLLVERCVVGERGRIGNLTVVKGLSLLRIDEAGLLGNLNWVTGLAKSNTRHFQLETERYPGLVIERHAAVTHRHILDCTDQIVIGAYSTFGGFASQILTHAIDLRSGRQSCAPVTVGAYCFVGTGAILLKGSVLPDKSVLGPGSVLTKRMGDTGWLYSGVPAAPVRPIAAEQGYFIREIGYVD